MGVRGVIEGDATHTSFAWIYEKLGYLPEEIDWDAIHEERNDGARASAGDPEVALIDSASSFPYTYGFDFMTAITLSGGLTGRAAAFESRSCRCSIFPRWRIHLRSRGIRLKSRIDLAPGTCTGFCGAAGCPTKGDELAIYDEGSEVVATWRVRFDDLLNAGLLRDSVNADSGEVAWSAVLHEDDVFVFAAESDETLLAWAAQPLDTMAASLVPKAERRRGGAVSVGNCMQSRHFSLPNPPPLLR
jgi:hypothetical protein